MSTPYFEDGRIDCEGLKRETRFVAASGCQGCVWGQSNDAVDQLYDDMMAFVEKRRMESRPISVRVRQTPGGPRIFVDGKPIPARAFYGSGPSIGFIAEQREYTFTLPFVSPFDTSRAEVRIGFPSVPAKFWIHDVMLVDGETGKEHAVGMSLAGALPA